MNRTPLLGIVILGMGWNCQTLRDCLQTQCQSKGKIISFYFFNVHWRIQKKSKWLAFLIVYNKNNSALPCLTKDISVLIKDDLIEIEKVTHFNDYKVKTFAIYEDEMNLTQTERCLESVRSFVLVNFWLTLRIHLVTLALYEFEK